LQERGIAVTLVQERHVGFVEDHVTGVVVTSYMRNK